MKNPTRTSYTNFRLIKYISDIRIVYIVNHQTYSYFSVPFFFCFTNALVNTS
uniref:Uncharacterized protein n=1 Tax=Solanum lycopersicum TaxID=4081 RepID=A0A3Q7GTC2_SOLLC